MAKIETYTLLTTYHASNVVIIGDSQDTDVEGDFKTKSQRLSVIVAAALDDTKADQVIGGAAGSFDYPTTNPAPLDTDTGTNGSIKRQLMDDTTEEFVIGQDKVCSDLNLSGNATIIVDGYAVLTTPSTTTKIEMTVRVSSKTAGESWDAAFTTTVSGDLTLKTTQDAFDHHSFTVIASTLGIAANDDVRYKFSRTAPASLNLSGDYGVIYGAIRLPRT